MIYPLGDRRSEALAAATSELRAGGLVVIPTDTVYGLAADAFSKAATTRIFELKHRPRALPLPVMVARPRVAWALGANVPHLAEILAAAFWPGALTMIVPAGDVDWDIGVQAGTLAVRMPAHPDLLELLEGTGPLAVTSANITGDPTPPTVREIEARFGDAVGVYLDGGRAPLDAGSTIVDLTGPAWRIVREGPIAGEAIEAAIAAH